MAFPMYTQGEIRTDVASMNIGDFIAAEYTTNAYSEVGEINTFGEVSSELTDYSSDNLMGVIYYMKMDKGLLVPCCQMGNTLSYYNLAFNNLIHGTIITLNDQDFLWRLLSEKEFNLMRTNLGGVIDVNHKADQFGSGNEWVSNINYQSYGGVMNVASNAGTVPTFVATNTTTNAFRLALSYVDNPNSTDLYH